MYKNLKKYVDKKQINTKEKVKVKDFKTLSTKEKDDLLEQILKDFGYISVD